MYEFLKDTTFAVSVVAVQGFYQASVFCSAGIDADRLPTAGAGFRQHILIGASVQIFLYMGNNHVALGYQNAAAGMQLQILIKLTLCRLALDTSQPSISTVSKTATGAISPVRPVCHSIERKTVS